LNEVSVGLEFGFGLELERIEDEFKDKFGFALFVEVKAGNTDALSLNVELSLGTFVLALSTLLLDEAEAGPSAYSAVEFCMS